MLCSVKARTHFSFHKLCRNHPCRHFLIMIVVTLTHGTHRATTLTDVISLGLTHAGMPIRMKIFVIKTDCQGYVRSEPAVGIIV